MLLKKWEGKMLEACETGLTKIVKLLLENYNCEESGLNFKCSLIKEFLYLSFVGFVHADNHLHEFHDLKRSLPL